MKLHLMIAAALSGSFFRFNATEGTVALLDLDDVLNQNVDAVENAPEFCTPPDGSYVLTISKAFAEKYKTKNAEGDEEERTRIKLIYGVVATKELANSEDQPVPDGALFSEQFMTNPDGLSYFKRQAKNVLGEDTIKGATIGAILQELPNGHTFAADVKLKKTTSKNKETGEKRQYTNVQVRIKPQAAAETPAAA